MRTGSGIPRDGREGWLAQLGRGLVVVTVRSSGKAKRLRNGSRACSPRATCAVGDQPCFDQPCVAVECPHTAGGINSTSTAPVTFTTVVGPRRTRQSVHAANAVCP